MHIDGLGGYIISDLLPPSAYYRANDFKNSNVLLTTKISHHAIRLFDGMGQQSETDISEGSAGELPIL